MMKFSFGIITNKGENLDLILKSIIKQVPDDNFEIIIVGNCSFNTIHKNIKQIDFDESIKPAWITKKKNIITENASFENIVYMHDYITLEENWYSGFIKFGNDWDVCINPIINLDNTRFRDLNIYPFYSELSMVTNENLNCFKKDDLYIQIPGMNKFECLIPYNLPQEQINQFKKWQYISGSYWIAKKKVMEEFPLNNNLIWCESEDIEWSERVKEIYSFSFNINSVVKIQKQKPVIFNKISNNSLDYFFNKYHYNKK